MAIGQELLNVPMGDMIRQMAFAIADGQYKMDENSINVAEMMGGLTTVYDENGESTFDDSRVFFGYEYMTLAEAKAYAVVDDGLTGGISGDTIKLVDLIQNIEDKLSDAQKLEKIRVPVRHSMMELGFTPTFYQFVDTIIEVKIAIKITRTREFSRTRTDKDRTAASAHKRKRSFWGTRKNSSHSSEVSTSQVDATYASKYSYSAEGASILRTKIVPTPVPAVLEDRIRSMMETEEALREEQLTPDPVP